MGRCWLLQAIVEFYGPTSHILMGGWFTKALDSIFMNFHEENGRNKRSNSEMRKEESPRAGDILEADKNV